MICQKPPEYRFHNEHDVVPRARPPIYADREIMKDPRYPCVMNGRDDNRCEIVPLRTQNQLCFILLGTIQGNLNGVALSRPKGAGNKCSALYRSQLSLGEVGPARSLTNQS